MQLMLRKLLLYSVEYKMKNELLDWLNGPVTHLHIRHQSENQQTGSDEFRQFNHAMAIEYLRLLSGESDIRITDTNHAMLSFTDIDNLRRPETEDKEVFKSRLIKQASDETLKRIIEIKKENNSKVIVGIEADIIDDEGHLSLNEECLRELDYVVASFHRFIWSVFSEEKNYTVDYIVNLYLKVLDNPHVTVLGHPARPSARIIGQINAIDYLPILEKMHAKGVAFEVNVLNDLGADEEKVNRDVIKICVQLQVPLVFSLDFHAFSELEILKDLPIENQFSEENLSTVFKNNDQVHFRIFRRLFKNLSILKELGVEKEMVVNHSDQNFNQWLAARKEVAICN